MILHKLSTRSYSHIYKRIDIIRIISMLHHAGIQLRYFGKSIANYPKLITNTRMKIPGKEDTHTDKLVDTLKNKILFSTFFVEQNVGLRWKIKKMQEREKINKLTMPMTPIACNYLLDEDTKYVESENEETDDNGNESFSLPYSITYRLSEQQTNSTSEQHVSESDYYKEKEYEDCENKCEEEPIMDSFNKKPDGKNWMSDYECFEEMEEGYAEQIQEWGTYYGTANPESSSSKIPCGGCGAHLHCQNPAIPGYIPQELFDPCTDTDLRAIICQRCHFLKNYNTALSVTVDPEQYSKLIESIKHKRALIILIVDVTDFPCSIWPGIFNVIGDKPLIIVGNKIDLIPGDCQGWLNQVKKSLVAGLPESSNIKYVGLISAKTGFGIEQLITKLQINWLSKGDVYLIGCTNVGKSTLFNRLIQSDYCKVKAVDLVQRATTSLWPGTTLNLLKFPILRPSGWRLHLRTVRLRKENYDHVRENEVKTQQAAFFKTKKSRIPELIGNIGRTFLKERDPSDDECFKLSLPPSKNIATSGGGLDDKDPDYAKSKWCYDTPGVMHPDQILDLLTMEELQLMQQEGVILPRIFSVRPQQTLFIGGIARIDFLEGDKFIRFIVYSPSKLPIMMCATNDADEVYNTLLGTEVLGVPFGGEKRISQFPKLKASPNFEFVGWNPLEVCGEIVLSNAGWVSFVARSHTCNVLRSWTPDGRGIYARTEPLLKYMPQLRRSRFSHSPQYMIDYRPKV